jgi:hypothetical protein
VRVVLVDISAMARVRGSEWLQGAGVQEGGATTTRARATTFV